MLKRVFSLLFAAIIFMPSALPAAAGVKTFTDTANNNIASGISTENNIHFAKDYSGIIADVCKNFFNDITSLTVLLSPSKIVLNFDNPLKTFHIVDAIFAPDQFEKKNSLYAVFNGFQNFNILKTVNFIFFAFIMMFILRYIGLLRLFSANSFFTKHIEV